ncbi:sugar ABC transporter ATP-binding protein [Paracoccus sp. Z330]|uniref:Sugar ABC transporter ATP-binding protein n=1 Tax=Paracoccus onchidii TaxID=3017813 RepID=A0ABT4ZJS7_9RHOB|nr:sugar ABC transporter ATP-binding protein [Paracoccus onchidii]MDB6179615.1 sugar ABC transporter ATP-binding protein [Paracoccus onchidii]
MKDTATKVSPILSVRGLSKTFAGKPVVRNLSFDLHPGQVMALVGENGAGKSTTKNMICGLLEPTDGEIQLDGETFARVDPSAHGIAAVHQELSLFQTLTVAENMSIHHLPGSPVRVDWAAADRIAREQLDFLGMGIDPQVEVATLGAGKQQIVEIGKALLQANRVLILDEPTTSLTAIEREKLFAILDRLKERGLAIIFISHFMEEIYRVCDSYVVLRDGEQVGAGKLAEASRKSLEAMMVGRSIGEARLELTDPQERLALRVEGLCSADFHNVNFTVAAGEILGIAGLMGAGRTELAEAIFGLRPATGKVVVGEEEIRAPSVAAMKRRGACYVPEDRRLNGLFLNRPVRENLSAAAIGRFVTRKLRSIGFRGEVKSAAKIVDDMNIAVPHIENAVGDLSGGNQQKVLLGRWLATRPRLIVFDEPTKGVDIGAKFDIHNTISELARDGVGVVMVSSDLPELLNTAHRIVVMRKGRLVGQFHRDEFDAARIISLAASAGKPADV